MKLVLTAILAAAIAGCTSDGDQPEVSAAPSVGHVAHGYETEDGRVNAYSTVDTGAEDPRSGGDGDYSGRAVAR